jgi:hypothetical protein
LFGEKTPSPDEWSPLVSGGETLSPDPDPEKSNPKADRDRRRPRCGESSSIVGGRPVDYN